MSRVVPPAWSPVGVSTLAAALGGLLRPTAARRRVEEGLTARFGTAEVTLVDSGTTALRLALAGANRDGPVALPAWGCFDLATALDGAGRPARLYDVDPGTLGPDWDDLARVVGDGVSAIVIVHPFGMPVDAPRAAALAAKAGVPLIEDAAQAAGALVGDKPAGAFGGATVLSFGRGKGLAGGTGGALLVRDPLLATRVAALAPHRAPSGPAGLPVLVALLLLGHPAVYGLVAGLPFLGLGETPYHSPHPPRGLAGLAAGAVGDTLGRLDSARSERALRAARLAAAAGPLTPPPLPGSVPSFLRLPVILPPGADIGDARRVGVVRSYPGALADLPGFRDRVVNRRAAFPGARVLAERLVTVPTHRWVGARDLAALEAWLVDLVAGGGS